MRTVKKELRTTAIFKCVVTMKNGAHKIVRMAVDKVAKFAAAMRDLHASPWLSQRYKEFFDSMEIDFSEVSSCKFINERTGEELLTIA
jgi:hypothetical protein